MKRFNLLALSLVLLLVFIAACTPQVTPSPGTPSPKGTTIAPTVPSSQGRWEQTIAAARTEGKLMVYGEISTDVRNVIARAMKEKYDIEAEFVIGKAPEVAQKFFTERSANLNLADVFILGAGTLIQQVKPRGVLMPIAPVLIQPGMLEAKAWPGGEVPYMDKDKSVLPIAPRYTSYIIRNTEMTKEDDIRSFQDLLNPKWKGKIVMFDPTIAGSASDWTTLILTKIMSLEDGKKFLHDFAKQEPAIIKDARLPTEWVARGKYLIAIGATFATIPEFQEAGAPIAWVKVKEGGLMAPGAGCFACPDKPAHPNASIVFANWLFSTDGQTVFSKAFGAPPIRLDASKEGFDPLVIANPGEKVYLNDEDFINGKPKALEVGKEIFGPLMK